MKINAEKDRWFRSYKTALRRYFKNNSATNLKSAERLGRKAVALGLEILDLARLHTKALSETMQANGTPQNRRKTTRQAKRFFVETIVQIEKTHTAALNDDIRVTQLSRKLCRHTAESSAMNQLLKRGVTRRKEAESALKKSSKQRTILLQESKRLQEHLRYLTHEILSAQEDDRRKISRRLHNEVAQTLLAINVRMLTLKESANANRVSLKKKIVNTQRLVRKSVKEINIFADEFQIKKKK